MAFGKAKAQRVKREAEHEAASKAWVQERAKKQEQIKQHAKAEFDSLSPEQKEERFQQLRESQQRWYETYMSDPYCSTAGCPSPSSRSFARYARFEARLRRRIRLPGSRLVDLQSSWSSCCHWPCRSCCDSPEGGRIHRYGEEVRKEASRSRLSPRIRPWHKCTVARDAATTIGRFGSGIDPPPSRVQIHLGPIAGVVFRSP